MSKKEKPEDELIQLLNKFPDDQVQRVVGEELREEFVSKAHALSAVFEQIRAVAPSSKPPIDDIGILIGLVMMFLESDCDLSQLPDLHDKKKYQDLYVNSAKQALLDRLKNRLKHG